METGVPGWRREMHGTFWEEEEDEGFEGYERGGRFPRPRPRPRSRSNGPREARGVSMLMVWVEVEWR